MTRTTCVGIALFAFVAGACSGGHDFEPPDPEERVGEAAALYSAALFDTLTWESDEARQIEGNAVYAAECRRCHGTLGEGGTEYALERDLEVPSLIEEEWALADSLDAVRRVIFTGHVDGMPTWGVGGITPREIDAVSHYVLEVLRPDALGGA